MAPPASPDLRIDWATANVTPDATWINRVDAPEPPNLSSRSFRALRESKLDVGVNDLDDLMVEVMLRFHRLYFALASHYFESVGLTQAVSDLKRLQARHDFTNQMLWDYITHWGDMGAALLDWLDTDEMRDAAMYKVVQTLQAEPPMGLRVP